MDGYPGNIPGQEPGFPNPDGYDANYQSSFMGPPQRPASNTPASNNEAFRVPPRPRRKQGGVEDRATRQERYDRIEHLAKELKSAVRDEITSRKERWDADGGREEEEYWEQRKKTVYKGLEELAEEIQRAFRDRNKEAVMDLWSKETEERRVNQARPPPPRQDN